MWNLESWVQYGKGLFLHALSHWWRVYGSQIKKRQAKPNPNDSQCETLEVGSNVVNDSSFMHCHTGGVFMAAKLKKRQTDRQNLTVMTLNVEP